MVNRVVTSVIVMLAAAAVQAGVRYEAVTTAAGEKGTHEQRYAVEAWVDGDNARIDFTQTAGGIVPDDGYLITTDGSRTLYLVNPKDRTYMRWDLDAMLQSFGSVMDAMGGVVQMEFTAPEVSTLQAEPGDAVLGRATTHYHYSTGYTMVMSIMGMKRQYRVDTVYDVWATDTLTAAGFGAWLRKEPPETGNEQLDALIRSAVADIEGLPLRTKSTTTTTDGKGRSQVTHTTMEVTALEETDVDPAKFEIPAGYQQVEMPDLADMSAGGDERGDGPKGLGDILKSMGKGD